MSLSMRVISSNFVFGLTMKDTPALSLPTLKSTFINFLCVHWFLNFLGPAKTKELIITGEMITADEALKIGLVNKVVTLDTKSDILTRMWTKFDPILQPKRSKK